MQTLRFWIALPILMGLWTAPASAAEPVAPSRADTVAPVASGVWLLPDRFDSGRQPDGNSVLLEGRDDIVVIDTGRHLEHGRADRDRKVARPADPRPHQHILAPRPPGWHRLAAARSARPAGLGQRGRTEALSGIMARNAAELQRLLADSALDETAPRVRQTEVAPLAQRAALAPNNKLQSAPAWQATIACIEALPFDQIVPGHGPVMSRADFVRYRKAFDGPLACASSDRPEGACAMGWVDELELLLAPDAKPRAGPMPSHCSGQRLHAAPNQHDRHCVAR